MLFKRYNKLRSGDILKRIELETTFDRIQFLKEARSSLIRQAKSTLRARSFDCDNVETLVDLMDQINKVSVEVREKRPRFNGNVRDLRDEIQNGEIMLMVKAGAPIKFNIKTHRGDKFIVEWKEGNTTQKQVLNDNNTFSRTAPSTGEDSVDKSFKYTVYRIYSPGVIKAYSLPWGELGRGMCWFVSKGINFEETLFNPSDYMTGNWGYQDLEYIDILDGGTQSIRANGCAKLLEIEADYISLDERRSAKFIFKDCKKLKRLPKNSMFKCNNFNGAFSNCHELIELPNIDMSNSDDNQNAFEYCKLITKFKNNTLKINKNADCNNMALGCTSLLEIPNITYGNEALGRGTSFLNTFKDCISATKMSPRLDLSYCRRGISSMFLGCESIIDGPSEILLYSNINDSARYSVASMFEKCKALRSITNQITSVNVNSSHKMYSECVLLKAAPKCVFINVLNCSFMYANCHTLVTPPETIDYPNAWDAASMFEECRSMQSTPTVINLNKVKSITKMFYNCAAISTGPSSINIASSINNVSAFEKCSSLENFGLAGNTVKLHEFSDNQNMFTGCAKLKTVCSFNGGLIFTSMFRETGLESHPTITTLSSAWFDQAFRDSKIKTVDFNRIVTPNVMSMISMFHGSQIEGSLIIDLSAYEKCISFNSLLKQTKISSLDIKLPNYSTSATEICNHCNNLKTVKINMPHEETKVENLLINNNYLTSIEINGNFKRSHSLFAYNPTATKTLKINAPKWQFCGEETSYHLNRFTMLESCDITTDIHLRVLINNNKKLQNINLNLEHQNKLTTSVVISLNNNNLNKEALDQIFTNLPDIKTFTKEKDEYIAEISIASNPGTTKCDTSIATDKGWIVYKT